MTDPFAPRYDVRISGVSLSSDVTDQVISVSYENNLDLADMFTIVLANPDNRFTDSALFDLGKMVELYMGYGNHLEPMMLGEITGLQPAFPAAGGPTMTITGYDKSWRMRHNQPDRKPFQYVNDSLIAAQLAVENGLIPIVDPSPFFHKDPLHQTDSDMAFLKERAKLNYFDVYVHWDKLYFQLPRPQGEAVVLEWHRTLSSFSPRLSNAGQAGIQVIRGYNEDLAQAIVGLATGFELDLDDIVEKLGSAAIDMLVQLGRRVIRTHAISSPFDAVAVAKSVLQDLLEGMYEGSGTTFGTPELRAGRFVLIRGVGKRFSGSYRLKKVTHTIDGNGYQTTFDVTQRAGTSILQLLRKSMTEEPPPDQQGKFYGLAVAEVRDNVDPELRGRVRVHFPWFSDDHLSGWARVAAPMAGGTRGIYFLPDRGDEVLVAFEHGNFAKPVVIGSLWNGVKRPPTVNAGGLNAVRMIKTGAGHTITFDDTPAKEQIVITDKIGNEIRLSSNGKVSISATQNIELNAPLGDIVMNATNVRVHVTGTMDVSG